MNDIKKITNGAASRRAAAHRWLQAEGRLSQGIEQPASRKEQRFQVNNWLPVVLTVLVILLAGGMIWLRAQSVAVQPISQQVVSGGWYAVKLLDGEVVYGKVENLATDPIVIRPAYYIYDQVKDSKPQADVNEAGDLRLVKRGQETHGPDGAMQVFRTQVVFLERLRDDSKVLEAIMKNEGQK